jgi:Holliday junction resolvase RusA-like endonuclease
MAKDGGERGRSPLRDVSGDAFLFELDIRPQPKQRPRVYLDDKVLASTFQRAAGDVRQFMALVRSQATRAMTPEQTRRFEEAVRLAATAAMRRQGLAMFTTPVAMNIVFHFHGDPAFWPTAHSDGDLDNLEKSLKDALIGVVYADDRLVVKKTSEKVCGKTDRISVEVCHA